jgi:hypothetical protein
MTRMCCVCHKVEQGGEWRDLRMVSDDKRVTHGYCPVCFAETMVQIEDFIDGKVVGTFRPAALSTPNGSCRSCV